MANDQFPGGSRRLWWLAAIAYGLANILLHEPANDIAKRLVVVLGLQLFLWSTRAFFLAGAVLVLFLCRHLSRDSQTVRRLLIFIPFAAAGSWTLGMSLLVFLLSPDPYLMRSQKTDSFWLVSSVKTHYHVLTATESTILLGVVLIATAGLYWPDRSRAPAVAIPLLAEEGWLRRAERRRRRSGAKREPDRAKPQ